MSKNMTWKEFKDIIDRKIRDSGLAEDVIEIDHINYWGDDDLKTETDISIDIPSWTISICKKDADWAS